MADGATGGGKLDLTLLAMTFTGPDIRVSMEGETRSRPVPQRLADVVRSYLRDLREIGDRSRDLQHPVIPARRQAEALRCVLEERPRLATHRRMGIHPTSARESVAGDSLAPGEPASL